LEEIHNKPGKACKTTACTYTTLQTVRHRFNIYASSCVALALWCGVGYRTLVTRFGVIRRV